MTIPTIIETHWLETLPLIHELQGMHEDHDIDFLAVQWSEIPAPTRDVQAVYPEWLPTDKPSLLERLIAWLLGPKP